MNGATREEKAIHCIPGFSPADLSFDHRRHHLNTGPPNLHQGRALVRWGIYLDIAACMGHINTLRMFPSAPLGWGWPSRRSLQVYGCLLHQCRLGLMLPVSIGLPRSEERSPIGGMTSNSCDTDILDAHKSLVRYDLS